MEIIASRKEGRKPKFIYGGHPEMIDKEDLFEWYNREFDRWENGYNERGVQLNGFQYYHCTVTKMSEEDGNIITPWWRDADELITEGYYRALGKFQDQLIPKRRGVGLSGLYGITLPQRMMKILPGSINLMTSADKGRVDSLFQKKFLVGWEHEDSITRSEKVSLSQHGTNVQMELRSRNFTRKKETEKAWRPEKATMLCRQTSDRPSDVAAFESQRGVSLFLDEIILHPRADGVLRSNQATLNRGMRKMYPIVMGGSAGEAVTEGIEVCKNLLKKSGKTVEVTFVPGTLGINEAPEYDDHGEPTGRIINFCVNGWSDQEAAMDYIIKRRTWLEEHAPDDLMAEIKTYPIAVEEVFQGDNTGHLPQELVPRLEMTYNKVISEPPPIYNARIVNDGSGEQIIHDPTGPCRILEEPKTGVIYGAGCDPIELVGTKKVSGKKAIKTGEKSALVFGVKNYTTDQLVCTYVSETVFPEVVMSDLIAIMNHYNNCKMMLERNKGKVLYHEFERNGLINKYLNYQPSVFGTQEVNYNQTLYGYHKGNGTAPLIDKWFLAMLKRSMEKNQYQEVLEQYFKYGTVNTDYISMQEAIEVGYQQWLEDQKKSSSASRVEHEVVTTELDKDGHLVQVVTNFSTLDPNQKITTDQQREQVKRMLIAGKRNLDQFQSR